MPTQQLYLSAEDENSLRWEFGYPLKTYLPGPGIPLELTRQGRSLRPMSAPMVRSASRTANTGTNHREHRTRQSYNKFMNYLDKTGRLPGSASETRLTEQQTTQNFRNETMRPSQKFELDTSPEAVAARIARAKYLRYVSEYMEKYGTMPPGGIPDFMTDFGFTAGGGAGDSGQGNQRPQSAGVLRPGERPSTAGHGGGGNSKSILDNYTGSGKANGAAGTRKTGKFVSTLPNRHVHESSLFHRAHHNKPSNAVGRHVEDPYDAWDRGMLVNPTDPVTERRSSSTARPHSAGPGTRATHAPAYNETEARQATATSPYLATAGNRMLPGSSAYKETGTTGRGPAHVTEGDIARTKPWGDGALGQHVVPGAANAKLVGGRYRYLPNGVEGQAAWTDYYGPVGGGGDKSAYYGRKYNDNTQHGAPLVTQHLP